LEVKCNNARRFGGCLNRGGQWNAKCKRNQAGCRSAAGRAARCRAALALCLARALSGELLANGRSPGGA
jgi:hypothetical protein